MTTPDNIKFEVVDDEDAQLFNHSNRQTAHVGTMPSTSTTFQESTINNFEKMVIEYIRINKPKLYILTPCFGSVCFVNYVNCIMATVNMFQKLGFPIQVEFCKNDSLVSRARNNLIAKAMHDNESTHFLFIDNDITWDPIDILKLVLSDKPLVGGIYPLKHYHWEKLVKDDQNPYNTNVVQSWITKKDKSQLKDIIPNENIVQHNLLRYNINYLENTLTIENNLTKVRHLATGFMMIQRNVIEKMSKAFPSTKYIDDVGFLTGTENNYAYALFDCGVEDGHYFSEDWLFCSRWSKMGGFIHADVSISLTHTGIEDYKGCYISTIL
jgi:hypothetical protein